MSTIFKLLIIELIMVILSIPFFLLGENLLGYTLADITAGMGIACSIIILSIIKQEKEKNKI
jgi:hypothetical protein